MLILASGSPRRRELLSLITDEFEILVSGCDEFVPEGTPAEKVPAILAEQKALAVAKLRPEDTVIGSDTVVVLNDEIFGKPKDKSHAHAMLKLFPAKNTSFIPALRLRKKVKSAPLFRKQRWNFMNFPTKPLKNISPPANPWTKPALTESREKEACS